MTPIAERMHAQHLVRPLRKPAEVVRWFGAMQAQDYYGALWAVGLRCASATEAAVERALLEGGIVRSWPLRGTLHFVPAEDLRWILSVTAAPVLARARRRFEQLGLDDATFTRARRTLERALDGRELTRAETYRALQRARVSTRGQRGIHIVWRLAHDGLLCFGARRGKQQTFTLLRAPGRRLAREEALHALAERYFRSHGPATLQDFSWWTGLPARELRPAAGAIGRDGGPPRRLPPVRLLPAFDEYLVGYRDRSAVLDDPRLVNAGGGMLAPAVVANGRVVGTWKRTLGRKGVLVSARLVRRVDLRAEAERYGAFLGLRASVDAAG
ncbi:MAG TPA: winged helix DNA-binding domain-containing protein [Myxococcales bacterium]|nr:winged helix DNA-binding domain-containing protein [Myxococcales bacterium]